MVVSINFENQHNSQWYKGYHYKCEYKFKKDNSGPKNGTPLKLTNLPVKGDKNYIRFWAAKKNPFKKYWKTIDQAYDEQCVLEEEPSLDYFNGGWVKIDKRGTANIRIIVPSGYINNSGEKEEPHIHFRICSNDQMSHVYTVPIKKSDINSSISIV